MRLVAVAALVWLALTAAAGSASPGPRVVRCESIVQPGGVFTWTPGRVVLDVAAVPPAYIPQTVPTGSTPVAVLEQVRSRHQGEQPARRRERAATLAKACLDRVGRSRRRASFDIASCAPSVPWATGTRTPGASTFALVRRAFRSRSGSATAPQESASASASAAASRASASSSPRRACRARTLGRPRSRCAPARASRGRGS